ncbi:MAG TPA: T9SS type A sorting domain-containing protein [Chitinophagaceae bacterium]|nr:T9SS type A sorting domain-containing protein [Chitinophagaceae bacterium]
MKIFIHKLFYYRKKIGLTLVFLVLAGWFVYAGNGGKEIYDYDYYGQPNIVKFYPNPATSLINFEFPNEAGDSSYILQIYSFTGRKMTEMPVNSNKITLTLTNDYYRGLYIFHLVDKSGKLIEAGKFQVIR